MGIISGTITANAALGAASGLLSPILGALGASDSNKQNLKIARETNQLNYQMFREGQNWQKYMWNLQNEYNLPANQVQRLLAAGINPAAAIDAPQLGAASSAPSGVSPNAAQGYQYQSPFTAAAAQSGQIANNLLAFSQAQKNISETKGQEIDNQFKADTAKANIKSLLASGLVNETQADWMQQQIDLTNANWNSLMMKAQQEAYFTSEQARSLKIANDLMETYGNAIKQQELKKITEDVAYLLEQQDTEKAKRRLMQIQGDQEKARTIIMRDQQRQEARESNSRISINNLESAHKQMENAIYSEFGRSKAASDFLEQVRRTENLVKDGKIKDMEGILKELEVDLRTLPANQRAAATGIWLRNLLPFLGWFSNGDVLFK